MKSKKLIFRVLIDLSSGVTIHIVTQQCQAFIFSSRVKLRTGLQRQAVTRLNCSPVAASKPAVSIELETNLVNLKRIGGR